MKQFKTESTNKHKCTLEEKLGGFLISKDTQIKVVAKEKESRKGHRNQHLMMAMDANDQIP